MKATPERTRDCALTFKDRIVASDSIRPSAQTRGNSSACLTARGDAGFFLTAHAGR